MSNMKNKSSNMAKGGILTAIGVILIYISGVIPINRLYLLMIASIMIPLSILITDVKNTIAVYAATSILSFLICGIRLTVIFYVLFFGIYGFVKLYIEKIHKTVVELILKLIFFNIFCAVMVLIYKLFFPSILNFRFSIYVTFILIEISFLSYDYLLTLIINVAAKKIHKINIY